MARLVFPDEGSRLVFRMTGSGKPLLSAAAGTATVFANEAGTVLADIQTLAGVTVAGSTLTVSAASQLPLFLGPDGADTVWCSVDSGPLSPVYARSDDRLDALVASVLSVRDDAVLLVNGNAPDSSGNVVLAAGSVVDATTATKGVVQLGSEVGGTAFALTTPSALHKTGAETASGVKTFNDGIIVPDSSLAIGKISGLQAALDAKAATLVALNTQTASYTVVLADSGKVVQMNSASGNTLTVPTNASAAFAIGTVIGVAQIGVGLTTVAPAVGVTLTWNNGTPGTGAKNLSGQYAEASLLKVAADTWRLTGSLAA